MEGVRSETTSPVQRVQIGECDPLLLIWYADF